MRILFILLTGILFSAGIHAQDLAGARDPFVVFKKEMNQNGDFLMIKTDRESYEEDSLGVYHSYYDLRNLDTKKKFSSGSPNPRPAQEWWAWLCDRVLPEEVKHLFNLSNHHGISYGFMHTHLMHYEGVMNEAILELCLNDDFEIIQITLEFLKHDLLRSISDEQLKSIYKGIVECQASIREVLRPYDPYEYVDGEHGLRSVEIEANKVNLYGTRVYINGALRWGEKCKTEEPGRWKAIVDRFEQTIKVGDTKGKSEVFVK